jgi:hypothetical protein
VSPVQAASSITLAAAATRATLCRVGRIKSV